MTTTNETKATETTVKPKSALATLKALSSKKPVITPDVDAVIVAQASDPAIAGAVRKGKTSVVHLGKDPAVMESARLCAELNAALKDAESAFSVEQATMRDYGKGKRGIYNKTFSSDVTTVCVPYEVEVPGEGEDSKPCVETRYVQVICSNKYSVNADVVQGSRAKIGEWFPRLFKEDKKKILKPNAEELIRGILEEQGIEGEDLESAMATLFEEKVTVTTTEKYESEEQLAPEGVRKLLEQAVTRVAPGLKFTA